MEALFKQKLLDLRSNLVPQTFGEALFTHRYFSIPSPLGQSKILEKEQRDGSFTEQKHLIESLERFVEEKISEHPDGQGISVGDKAQIALKKSEDWFKVSADYLLSSQHRDLILKDKSQVEVIFVTETLRASSEFAAELKGQFIDQLLCGFQPKTAELFERMILAMKLLPHEVILYPSEFEGKSLFEDIIKLTEEYKPKVIMTLGAKATTAVLKSKDRLAMVHGQFFPRKTSELCVQVVPLFHPNIIETNQNMKKTAWIDMQKVMRFLKKLP